MKKDIYLIADQIRSISNLGINYSTNQFDTERYEKLLSLSSELCSICDESDFSDIEEMFSGNLSHMSPIVGADAIIYQEKKILLMKRHDNKLWASPGGLVEVGETPAEAAVRELFEETGINGTLDRLLGVFDSRKWQSQMKFHMYHFLFLIDGDTSSMHTTEEALDLGFFSKDDLPPLSPGHKKWIPYAFELIERNSDVFCD
jgi:ADP-ribose pyrophosphatase YjhB (NUDIX family)